MARSRKTQEKDVISRLADAGEEALHRIGPRETIVARLEERFCAANGVNDQRGRFAPLRGLLQAGVKSPHEREVRRFEPAVNGEVEAGDAHQGTQVSRGDSA